MPKKSKLTNEQVAQIRERRKQGELLKVLSADFGVCMNYICRLTNYRDRKHAT